MLHCDFVGVKTNFSVRTFVQLQWGTATMESKIERVVGKLQSFDSRQGSSHGYARIGTALVHLPTSNRGVLVGDVIRPCNNGERYEKIPPETIIVADVNVDSAGKNPFPVAWAPKMESKCCSTKRKKM